MVVKKNHRYNELSYITGVSLAYYDTVYRRTVYNAHRRSLHVSIESVPSDEWGMLAQLVRRNKIIH